MFGQIARFAIEYQVDAVLAPTHFVGDPNFKGWFTVDQASCRALRRALDREGGSAIPCGNDIEKERFAYIIPKDFKLR